MGSLLSPELVGALSASPAGALVLLAAYQAYEISRLSRSLGSEGEKIFRLIEANELQTAVIRDLAVEVAFVRTRVEEFSHRH